jgi:hypothetical protein
MKFLKNKAKKYLLYNKLYSNIKLVELPSKTDIDISKYKKMVIGKETTNEEEIKSFLEKTFEKFQSDLTKNNQVNNFKDILIKIKEFFNNTFPKKDKEILKRLSKDFFFKNKSAFEENPRLMEWYLRNVGANTNILVLNSILEYCKNKGFEISIKVLKKNIKKFYQEKKYNMSHMLLGLLESSKNREYLDDAFLRRYMIHISFKLQDPRFFQFIIKDHKIYFRNISS